MDTKQPFVITISRELGSGGRTIGKKLAAQLNARFSDKNLIEGLMAKFNLSPGEIESIKAKKSNWFRDVLDFVAPVPEGGAFTGLEISELEEWSEKNIRPEEIFKAESEILREIAKEAPCVIAGRSGFFVLKDFPNRLDIFIRAPKQWRVQRVMRKQNLSEEEAIKAIDKVDKARENYIKRFAGVSRYDSRNYDLVLNVGNITDDEAVLLILKYIKATGK